VKNKEREGEAVDAGIFAGGVCPLKNNERSGGIFAKSSKEYMLLGGVDIA
jgi:hypothetical protein